MATAVRQNDQSRHRETDRGTARWCGQTYRDLIDQAWQSSRLGQRHSRAIVADCAGPVQPVESCAAVLDVAAALRRAPVFAIGAQVTLRTRQKLRAGTINRRIE